MELKYLSEWEEQLKELVADRISDLKGHFNPILDGVRTHPILDRGGKKAPCVNSAI